MRRKWKRVALSIPAGLCAVLVTLFGGGVVVSARLAQAPVAGQSQTPDASRTPTTTNGVNDDARIMAEFVKRVEAYDALRSKVERGLPRRGDKASPEEVVGHRKALAEGIRQVRADAKAGDLFTPDAQRVLRAMVMKVFKAPAVGTSAKAAVNEENPRGTRVAVNQPYPDGTPLTTMPPEVLKNLPQLPEALRYHFVGRTLILLDDEARLIVDYMPNAMP